MAAAVSPRGAQVIAWSYVTFGFAALVVSLRLVVRAKVVRFLGKEDACIFFALMFSLLACVFMGLEVSQGGLGRHWDSLTEDEIELFLKYSYFSIVFYNLSLCLTKFSILFLCLRVFAPSDWRKACIVVLVFISLYTTWAILASILSCIPIPSYWNRNINGWCFPTAVLWFMNASLNIFTDFLVVLLPIPGIAKLQLPRKQKIGVALVFALGFFVCIISIVRLYALKIGVNTHDSTYDNYAIAIWSVVEVNGAIVGACLPTLKPLISRVWPRLLSSGHSHRPTRSRTLEYIRQGTGADGTIDRARTERRLDDTESATEILGDDGVTLGRIDPKEAHVHVEHRDLDVDPTTAHWRQSTQWRDSSDDDSSRSHEAVGKAT